MACVVQPAPSLRLNPRAESFVSSRSGSEASSPARCSSPEAPDRGTAEARVDPQSASHQVRRAQQLHARPTHAARSECMASQMARPCRLCGPESWPAQRRRLPPPPRRLWTPGGRFPLWEPMPAAHATMQQQWSLQMARLRRPPSRAPPRASACPGAAPAAACEGAAPAPRRRQCRTQASTSLLPAPSDVNMWLHNGWTNGLQPPANRPAAARHDPCMIPRLPTLTSCRPDAHVRLGPCRGGHAGACVPRVPAATPGVC